MITLASKNLELSRNFYEKGLGWKASSVSNDDFVAFPLNGIVLCLYSEKSLAEDANVPIGDKSTFKGIALSHNVTSKDEVDVVLKRVVTVGAKLQREAKDVFWGGYSGYFSDLDGHLLEVAWNPHWILDDDGIIKLPK